MEVINESTGERLRELREQARCCARATARYSGFMVLCALGEADALATPTSSTTGIRIVLALLGGPGAAYMAVTEGLEHARLDRRIIALEADRTPMLPSDGSDASGE